jgi:hypothetical protein
MTILMRNSIPIENGILTFLRLQNNVRSEMSAVEWTGVSVKVWRSFTTCQIFRETGRVGRKSGSGRLESVHQKPLKGLRK